jgi:hypothetical protein
VRQRRLEKIKWSEKVINDVIERTEEKRTLLNNILRSKANYIRHILRRNSLIDCTTEGQMAEVKGAGSLKSLNVEFLNQTI